MGGSKVRLKKMWMTENDYYAANLITLNESQLWIKENKEEERLNSLKNRRGKYTIQGC